MSSFMNVVPEALTTPASDLTGIGSAIGLANASTAAQTTQVAVAAQDEMSAAIAALLGGRLRLCRSRAWQLPDA